MSTPQKHVVCAGVSGFVGSGLLKELERNGWSATILTRSKPRAENEGRWNPDSYELDPRVLAGADAVVCLNGAPLARWPWTKEYKQQLVDSRLKPVKTIADAINALEESERPRVFVSGSAVGYYGDRGNEVLTEQSEPADDFLGGLCQVWEKQAQTAKVQRVVNIRTGLVVDDEGGLVDALKPLFQMFAGGRLGDGNQWMPTVSRRDHVRAIRFLLESDELSGAFNLTGPQPITNDEFTQAVAAHFDRPVGPPAPAFGIRMVLGDMAVIALSSQYALPQRLTDAGFDFQDVTIGEQLRSRV
ncbi:MAG: TIGR01777 family oxidoreductase [Actinomycetaceae bacterium]|nr:TIGR01777 family oxidoreductase [Actinomycetaceae bacterium]